MRERFMLWENPKDAIITLMILLMVIGCVNVFPLSDLCGCGRGGVLGHCVSSEL